MDKFAIQNYNANFPNRTSYGDITQLDTSTLPQFDLLIGGTPCQNISLMRQQSESQEGLKGDASKLFFDFVRVLNEKRPKYFIFENVRRLYTSNKGKDWETVCELLGENYNLHHQLMNTSDYGLPQTRRRVYIVGQRKDLGEFKYEFPNKEELTLTAQDLLEDQVEDKYYLSERMYKTVMSWGTKGWKQRPETDLKIARPLMATMHKMHRAGTDKYYTTDYQPKDKTNLRRLTPREAARLQGIPEDYQFIVSDTQAYRLCGNAMSLNVVEKVARRLLVNNK